MTLLEKALAIPMTNVTTTVIPQEELELFFAYLDGEVRQKQVVKALGKATTESIYSWAHRVMMHCIAEGLLVKA